MRIRTKNRFLKKVNEDFWFSFANNDKFSKFREFFYLFHITKLGLYENRTLLYEIKNRKSKNILFKLLKKEDKEIHFDFEPLREHQLLINEKKVNNIKKYSKFKKEALNLKKFFNFYNDLKPIRLKWLAKKSKKTKKFSLKHFGILLESRLDSFLIRTQLFSSKFEAKSFIKSGKVFVNNQKITYLNYLLKDKDIVHFDKKYNIYLKEQLCLNLEKNKYVIENTPDYIIPNYDIMYFIFIAKLLDTNKIAFPFKFNIKNLKTFYKNRN